MVCDVGVDCCNMAGYTGCVRGAGGLIMPWLLIMGVGLALLWVVSPPLSALASTALIAFYTDFG